MDETTHTEWRRGQFREQRDPFHSFCSIRRPYITFKLPRGDMDTPPRLRNFFRYLAIGMCHFRYLWNGLCDHHRAEITVIQFTGHSLPVHHSEVGPSPCRILSAEHTCAISFDYGLCDRHRVEITIMQLIGHSLPVHHFFYTTVRIFFLPCLILWAKLYFTHVSFLASMWCNHIVVWTQLQLGRNPVLFYRRDQISIWSITYR